MDQGMRMTKPSDYNTWCHWVAEMTVGGWAVARSHLPSLKPALANDLQQIPLPSGLGSPHL